MKFSRISLIDHFDKLHASVRIRKNFIESPIVVAARTGGATSSVVANTATSIENQPIHNGISISFWPQLHCRGRWNSNLRSIHRPRAATFCARIESSAPAQPKSLA